jgi:hypothetical protein
MAKALRSSSKQYSILTRHPPIRFNRDIPPKLEDIIYKALEKDRNLSYQHASDMRTDLRRLKRDTQTGLAAAYYTYVTGESHAGDTALPGLTIEIICPTHRRCECQS